jgi:flagellar export protein FliJ
MRPFTFRAQVALDLRKRRDEAAQRDLAVAQEARASAATALEASLEARTQAFQRAQAAQAGTVEIGPLVWHRNWITAQQREIARRRDALDARTRDVQGARDRATRTHVDVRVLEKLKERAWRAYTLEVGRAEQKAIDWLAVLGAAARTRKHEEIA